MGGRGGDVNGAAVVGAGAGIAVAATVDGAAQVAAVLGGAADGVTRPANVGLSAHGGAPRGVLKSGWRARRWPDR